MPRLFPLCPLKVFGLVKSTYGDKEYVGAGLNSLLRLIPSNKSRQIHLFCLLDEQVAEWKYRHPTEGGCEWLGAGVCSPDASRSAF